MTGFLDILKSIKHSGPMPQVCPSCRSTRIRQHGSLNGWLFPAVYVCEDCGYAGKFVLELDVENESSRKR